MPSNDVIPAFTPSMVDVRLLGAVTISVAGRPVVLKPKGQLLVAALFGVAGRPVPADRLIDQIWDEEKPADPRGALHDLVRNLREALDATYPGARAVVTQRNGTYTATVDALQVDVHRFRSLLAQARELDRDGDTPQAGEHYRKGLDQWGGDLAEPDEPLASLRGRWVAGIRHGLQSGHLTALLELLAVELRLGRHPQAIPMLAQLTTLHPDNEYAAELQMSALCLAGRPTEALAVYRRLRTRLRKDTGREPSARVQQLHQRILKHDKGLQLLMKDDQTDQVSDQPATNPADASADSDAAGSDPADSGDPPPATTVFEHGGIQFLGTTKVKGDVVGGAKYVIGDAG